MKKLILGIVIGLLISGSIVGVVAYNYGAKSVGYNPSDSSWDVNNVEDALKSLRQASIDNKIDINNPTIYKNVSQGKRIPKRSTSLTLERGRYLIIGILSMSGPFNTSNSVNENKPDVINIECTNISGYGYTSVSTANVNGSEKAFNTITTGMWVCDLDTQTQVTIANKETKTYDHNTSSVSIQAIKIGN